MTEDTSHGDVVYTVTATDEDSSDHPHGQLLYSITTINGDAADMSFIIDHLTGAIQPGGTLDFDVLPISYMYVQVHHEALLNSYEIWEFDLSYRLFIFNIVLVSVCVLLLVVVIIVVVIVILFAR